MSGSYSSRLRGGGVGGGLGATTVMAAKVAFASAALAAAASLVRVAVPQLVSGADAFLWKLYLFVTVHVIIFVIWKFSDNKHFHAQQHEDPWAPVPHQPAPPLLTEEVVLSSVKRTVVSRPHIEAAAWPVDEAVVFPGSCGGESCVTTESEEDVASSVVAASAYVATAVSSRSVAPLPVRESAVVERGLSLPPPAVVAATDEHFEFDGADHDGGGGDDDLDATWNAIMQKTRPSTAPALSSSPQAPRSSHRRPSPSPRPRTPSHRSARRS